MKVALCFIISYSHILNKEQLWIDWIEPNKDIINVYFHYKDIRLIKSSWIKQHAINPKYIQNTSYYNVIPAYMALLSQAFHDDKENIWFSMLTESCVPIISPVKFRKIFLDNYNSSIIKCKPSYWNVTLHRRANLILLKKEYHLANDPWFTLTRLHVQQCFIFLTYKKKLFNQINAGGLANESIFAIILQTFNEITNNKRLINEPSSIADWTRMASPTSPYLFKEGTTDNINIIKNMLNRNKYALFLRKIDPQFPSAVLEKIMQMDCEDKCVEL